MKPRRKTSEAQPEQSSREVGDFRLDGSWNSSANAKHRGPLYAFVMDLARLRRMSKASPAQFAENILASKWAKAFGELEQWRTCARWEDWPFVWTRTSADETVKRAGIGAVESSHWQGGSYTAGEDERPFTPPSQEHAKALVAELAKQLGWKDIELPASDKPAPTQGHDPRCTCEACFAAARETATRAVGAKGA